MPIWMCGGHPQCGFQGAFFHILQSCGMNFLVRCFQDDTTWVPSKKAQSPSLKADNAPNVGGGDQACTLEASAGCYIIPTIWLCGGPPQCAFQKTFFHVLQSCAMSFLMLCRQRVIPLVLQEIVGGGDQLSPGGLYARFSSFSIK
ncbi:unnamed protein product [Leptidea sinapis]|uniref:Uncharacterized protein n=1 Tax=Leptidea sinapis TaxID=189913 RepID=A0A5E4QB83_9NEOP|nr:unnamed protein product [Leptidea sinapis]